MGEDIHELKGLTKEEIESRDEKVRNEVRENRKDIDRLDKCIYGNGKPGLQEVIMNDVDKKVNHEKNNRMQADVNLQVLITREEEERKSSVKAEVGWIWKNMDEMKERLGDNGEKMDNLSSEFNKLSNKLAYYAGGIAVLVIVIKYIHF